MKTKVSIIIVHYHADKEFFSCLDSLKKNLPDVPFEVIVVDNDENKQIENEIGRYSFVEYIKSPKNIGFGAGNNLGFKHAKGEYIFFLNPDTRIIKNAVDKLTEFLDKNKDAGIVSPFMLHDDHRPFRQQGNTNLTPLEGVVALSFINKLFPHNSISEKYWLSKWDRKSTVEIDVAPGTALMIRKSIFQKIKGFDERMFLFFEEFDLCKRVKNLGYKIYIDYQAKIIHLHGRSMSENKKISGIFRQSRYYYFKKHFGLFNALMVESFTRFGKNTLLISLIILLALFLRTYRLNILMTFLGDQGWYYLSARDLLINHSIPLVGIVSSHPWLHQGALWTYVLAFIFFFSNFNPLIPGYFTAVVDVAVIILLYKFTSEMYSPKTALICSLLYAASPLIILQSRFPYHTSLIPLFTLLFLYSLYKWVSGEKYSIVLIFFFLGILYNLELSTAVLWLVFFFFIVWGIWKRKSWSKYIFNLKIIFLSLTALVFSMLPMLIYDVQNGFPQTLKFLMWVLYKFLRLFGYPSIHPEIEEKSLMNLFSYSQNKIGQLIFSPDNSTSLLLFVLSLIYLAYLLFKNKFKISYVLIFITLNISLIGFLLVGTPSDAYLPVFFPLIMISLGLFFELFSDLIKNTKVVIMLVLIIAGANIFTLLESNYFSQDKGEGPTFTQRLEAAEEIIKQSDGKEYNLMNADKQTKPVSGYIFLTWLMGKGPSYKQQESVFIITESLKKITIRKINRL